MRQVPKKKLFREQCQALDLTRSITEKLVSEKVTAKPLVGSKWQNQAGAEAF